MTSIYPPIDPPNSGSDDLFWTFDAVEQRLVETVHLWRRMPGGGKWPFAGDGPWHLIRTAADATEAFEKGLDAAALGQRIEPDTRPLPLRRAEVREMEEATEWLLLAPERDRRLVVLAIVELANGRKQIPWMDLRKAMGVTFGAHGLRKRYSRAITAIANALNAAEKGRMGVSSQMVD